MNRTMHSFIIKFYAEIVGAFSSMTYYFLKIDVHGFMQSGGKVIEALFVGAAGAVGAYFGKKFIHFFIQKRDNHVGKNQ